MNVAANFASDRYLLWSLGASLVLHSALLLAAPMLGQHQRAAPIEISVQLVEISAERDPEPPVEERTPESKKKKITPPKLLSKPEILAPPSFSPADIRKDRVTDASEPKPEPSPVPDRSPASGEWNAHRQPGEAEGAPAGGGNPSVFGDLDAGIGTDGMAGAGRRGIQGAGFGAKGDGSGAAGETPSNPARPAGGYQVKPRYPESARRAGVQGTTVLKLQVLANGKVGEVLIEKSAGHRDLDSAAAEAVKKWLFEPARAGKTPVAVWVLLPVKFELE